MTLTNGLKSGYNFDNLNANDNVGGNNGVDSGVSYSVIDGRSAATFNGIDSKIEIAHDPTIDFGGDTTVTMWFKTSSLNQGFMFHKYNDATALDPSAHNLAINAYGNTNKLLWEYRDTDNVLHNLYSLSDVVDDTWHHVSLVHEGTNIKMYIDGVLDNSTSNITSGAFTSQEPIYLGKYHRPWNGQELNFYEGSMDEVLIWERALSDAEITDLYVNGLGDPASNISSSGMIRLRLISV